MKNNHSQGDKFVNLEIGESGKDPLKKGSELGTSADLINVSSCSEESMEDISRPLTPDAPYNLNDTIEGLEGGRLAMRIGEEITRELNEKKDEDIEIQVNAKPRLGMSSMAIKTRDYLKEVKK